MNRSTQYGAAMVESVLIIAGMVVLLVAIPKLAKYQDVRQSAVDASRYATWQMTVSEEADREKILDRMFSDPNAPIRSQTTQLPGNAFWQYSRQPLVRNQAFTPVQSSGVTQASESSESMVDLRSVNVTTTQRASSAGGVADTISGTVRTVSDWLGRSDAIAPNRGIVMSDIRVAISDPTTRDDEAQTCGTAATRCVSTSTSILVDGWEAKNSQALEAGAQVMVPSKLLKPIGRAMSAVAVVPLLKEFKDFDEGLGCINTTTLPTKELTGELAEGGEIHEC